MIAILSFLYASVGFITLVGYLPQIYALLKANGRSESISLSTWGFWCYTSTVAFLYALFVNGDKSIIFVSVVNAFGCWSILLLASYNRFIRFKDEEIVVVHMPKEQHPEQSQYQNLDVA